MCVRGQGRSATRLASFWTNPERRMAKIDRSDHYLVSIVKRVSGATNLEIHGQNRPIFNIVFKLPWKLSGGYWWQELSTGRPTSEEIYPTLLPWMSSIAILPRSSTSFARIRHLVQTSEILRWWSDILMLRIWELCKILGVLSCCLWLNDQLWFIQKWICTAEKGCKYLGPDPSSETSESQTVRLSNDIRRVPLLAWSEVLDSS